MIWFFLTLLIQVNHTNCDKDRPNIVILLADDLGRGSLSSYGNSEEKTPNIDRIFHEGAKFNHLLSPAALCTPSRSAFLTGKHPYRLGLGEGKHGPPVIVYAASKAGLPRNETTWANLAQNLGYATKAIGKWHMGMDEANWGDQEHGPLTHGFDSFYGLPFTVVPGFEGKQPFWTLEATSSKIWIAFLTLALTFCRGSKLNVGLLVLTLPIWLVLEHFNIFCVSGMWWWRSTWMERYLNSYLMSNTTVVERPIQLRTLANRLTRESINFIRDNAGVKPFLLYHAFHNLHDPVCVSEEFKGKGIGTPYSDSLVEMDHQVGEILDTIHQLNIEDDTIIFFTSDHGKIGLNTPLRGGKGAPSTEGGVRIPGAIRWPSTIPKGKVIHEPTSLLDFYPTLLDILEVKTETKELDGESFHNFIHKEKNGSKARMIYHFCGVEIHALRYFDGKGSIVKAIFVDENIDDEGKCREGICYCSRAKHLTLENIKIVNVTVDGIEKDCCSDPENDLRKLFVKTFKDYSKKSKPNQQLNSFLKVLPLNLNLHPGLFSVNEDM